MIAASGPCADHDRTQTARGGITTTDGQMRRAHAPVEQAPLQPQQETEDVGVVGARLAVENHSDGCRTGRVSLRVWLGVWQQRKVRTKLHFDGWPNAERIRACEPSSGCQEQRYTSEAA